MRYQQFLIIEISQTCNLSELHDGKCPANLDRNRLLPKQQFLTDKEIDGIIDHTYTNTEFRGYIGFHYYCEVLLHIDRVEQIINRAKVKYPQAKFILWTNAIPNVTEKQLKLFDKVFATDYGLPNQQLEKIKSNCPDCTIEQAKLDNRKTPLGSYDYNPCARVFNEIIIDAQGYLHLCCVDWEGENNLGNIRDGIPEAFDRFIKARNSVAGLCIKQDASELCKKCTLKYQSVWKFDATIAREAEEYRKTIELDKQICEPTIIDPCKIKGSCKLTRDITVVITAYKIPHERLFNFFKWNNDLFEKYLFKCIVVVDHIPDVPIPDYCKYAVYPFEMPIFNLSKTSNYGIRLAGSGKIIKADVDILFTDEFFHGVINDLPNTGGECPIYHMAESTKQEDLDKVGTWRDSKGVMAAHYSWFEKVHGYNELMQGYGIEDGDMWLRLHKAMGPGNLRRKYKVYHIAHDEGTPQEKGKREDQWNRDEGFNPRNHPYNTTMMSYGFWQNSKCWGGKLA